MTSRRLGTVLAGLAIAGAYLLGQAVPPPAADATGWQTVGTLDRPRAHARAVPLATGEILVVGGLDPAGAEVMTFRSELLDPASGGVTLLPDPLLGRVNHTATVGWGDRVVVAGGTEYRGTYWAAVDRVEVFIPYSRTWLRGAEMLYARSDHAAAALPDGRIFVTGGNVGSRLLASSEIYDPATDRWTSAAPMPRPRTQHSAVALPGGRVLVAGGFRDDGRITAATLVYDPASDRWSAGPDMIHARLNHAVVPLPAGDVLFVGGESAASATAERFDFRANRFVDAGTLSRPRLVPQAARLDDGRVLLTGGLGYPVRGGFRPLSDTEIWDPRSSSWQSGEATPSARAYGLLVRTERGIFRVSGSGEDEAAAQTVERFRW